MGIRGSRRYNRIIVLLVGLAVGIMGVLFLLFSGSSKKDSKIYISMQSVAEHESAFIYDDALYVENFGVFTDSEDIEVIGEISSRKIEVDLTKRTLSENLKSRNLTEGDKIGKVKDYLFVYDKEADVWIHYTEQGVHIKNSIKDFTDKEVEYSIYYEENLTSNKNIEFDKGFLLMDYEYLGSNIKDYGDLDYDKVVIFIKENGLINVFTGYKAVGTRVVIIHEIKGEKESLHKASINEAITVEVR